MDGIIAGFGEVMLRLTPAGNGRLLQALPGSLNGTFGGAEANVCASLALLGARARYLTALPRNGVSEACVAQLRGLGVEVDRILYQPTGRMGLYYTETGANQRSSQVIYDREHSVISECGPEAYELVSMLEGVAHLHVTGITPALSEKAYEATLELLTVARHKGIRISLDLNFRNRLWNWRPGCSARELAQECMTRLASLADIIIGNEEDAADVFGIRAEGADVEQGRLNVKGYEAVAQEMSRRFPQCSYIAFTLRESVSANHNNWGGMLYVVPEKRILVAPLNEAGDYAPYEIHHIVDRFGAGDSFCAGLIYALNNSELHQPDQAIRFAVAASCLKHSIAGDYNYVTVEEIRQLMEGRGAGRVRR